MFVRQSDPTGTSPLVTAELTLQARYARNEKFVSGAFERVSLGSNWPILTGTVTLGLPRVLGSEFNYQRWTMDAEGTHGWAPRPDRVVGTRRHVHRSGACGADRTSTANETALSINEAFNLLRFMEFASDRWVRGCAEWHGGDWFWGAFLFSKNFD